eukprot:550979-Prymnesium_polylepis.1
MGVTQPHHRTARPPCRLRPRRRTSPHPPLRHPPPRLGGHRRRHRRRHSRPQRSPRAARRVPSAVRRRRT